MKITRVGFFTFLILLGTRLNAADLQSVWRQNLDDGVLAVPDGPTAVALGIQVNNNGYKPTFRIGTAEFPAAAARNELFLAKINPEGGLLGAPVKLFSGFAPDGIIPRTSFKRFKRDNNGNFYICGEVALYSGPTQFGADNDPNKTILQSPFYEGSAYVASYGPTGSLRWVKMLNRADNPAQKEVDSSTDSLAADSDGNIYVGGQIYGVQNFTNATSPNIVVGRAGGNNRPWVAKLNGATGEWLWVQADYADGNNGYTLALAVGPDGNPYAAGIVGGGRPGPRTLFGSSLISAGEAPWVAKLDKADGHGIWAATSINTNGFYGNANVAHDLAVDTSGNAYVVGSFYGPQQFGSNTLQPRFYPAGDHTFFVAKVNGTNGTWMWARMGDQGTIPTAGSIGWRVSVDTGGAWVSGETRANYFYGAGDDGRLTFGGVTITNTAFLVRVDTDGNFQAAKPTHDMVNLSSPATADGAYYYTDFIGAGYLVKFGAPTAPQITAAPANITALPGTGTNLSATATGRPLYYGWLKNGALIGSGLSDASVNNTNGIYQLGLNLGLRVDELGSYQLVVSNSLGMVTSAVATVTSPAPFISGLYLDDGTTQAPPSVDPGTYLRIKGSGLSIVTNIALGGITLAQYSPSFDPNYYYLTFGSAQVISDSELRIRMPVCFLSDPITVQTLGGIAASVATVQAPGFFYQGPLTNTVGLGTFFRVEPTTSFNSVSADGFVYQWFKNNEPISGANFASLLLNNLQTNDTGSYRLAVSKGNRTNNYPAQYLSVFEAAPVVNISVTGSSAPLNVSLGNTANFSVTATSTGTLLYQWFKDGVALTNSARITGATSANLTIANAQFSDAGSYNLRLMVEGADPPLIKFTNPGQFRVDQSVAVLNVTGGGAVQPGATAQLQATVQGSPTLYFQWIKDGTNLLVDSGRITGAQSNILTITSFQQADLGSYALRVTNYNSSTVGPSLSLSLPPPPPPPAPPFFIAQPFGITNRVGSYVSLYANAVGGTSSPVFQWLKDGSPVAGQTNFSISFAPLALTNAGAYSLVASNAGGAVTSQVAYVSVTVRSNLFNAADVSWARQIGTTNEDHADAVCLDSAGNAVVVGANNGFSPAFGSIGLPASPTSPYQMFITKYDPSGNVIWSKSGGALGEHGAQSISIAPDGGLYVAGYFKGAIMLGASQFFAATNDFFVCRLDADGNYLWARQANRSGGSFDTKVKVEGTNLWWVGDFSGTLQMGSQALASAGGDDVFLAKLNPQTGELAWARSYGGTNDDYVAALSARGDAVYLGGGFNRNTVIGTNALATTASSAGYLIRVNPTNGDPVWAQLLNNQADLSGFPGFTGVQALDVDTNGAVYLTGNSQGTNLNFGSLSILDLGSSGNSFGFLAKVEPTNGTAIWLKRLNRQGFGNSIAIAPTGNVLVGGAYFLPDYDADAFVSTFDVDGINHGVAYGSSGGFDLVTGIAANGTGCAIVGSFDGFNQGGGRFGNFLLGGIGRSDAFIARLATTPAHRQLHLRAPSKSAGEVAVAYGHLDGSPMEWNDFLRVRVLVGSDIQSPVSTWLNVSGGKTLDDSGFGLARETTASSKRFYMLKRGE